MLYIRCLFTDPQKTHKSIVRAERGIFRRVRKFEKSDYELRHVCVCQSVHMERLGSHWTDFQKNLIFEDFF
jgi:hypothetical protein